MIKIALAVLNIIYCPFKLLPIVNKITFISRQSNTPSQDAELLAKEIGEIDAETKVIMLFRTMDHRISYCFHILRQMYHIATSRTVILDSYSIAVSVLKHRKKTRIIQMWHAMGALKKFGHSILGKGEGSDRKLAEAMRMHCNYDVIFTSSEKCRKHFAEAFQYEPKRLEIFSLPRVDLIKDKAYMKEIAETIFKTYPDLRQKKNVVYAPTFRKGKEGNEGNKTILDLIQAVDHEKYNLIIKMHPLSELDIKDERVTIDRRFSSIEMCSVADYIVLDYSAIVYEAALLEKPLFFYAFDLKSYQGKRDFYIDYEREMPGVIADNASRIIEAIETEEYDIAEVKAFADKYVENQKDCSRRMAEFILKGNEGRQ